MTNRYHRLVRQFDHFLHMYRYRRYKILVFILLIALILDGCILERIFTVKNQLCDFENNFQIEFSEGFRVLLQEPVMLDNDITWLAGAEPSRQEFIDGDLVMTYIAERKGFHSQGQFDLPIELRFTRHDGAYRLKEGYLSKNLTDMLTEELLTQIMQSVCRSEKSLVKQQVIIDISTLDRTLLPTRSEVVGILGPPNPEAGLKNRQVYNYQLKNNPAADKETVIDIEYDETGINILKIKVKYLRYNLNADFAKGEAVLSVDIFDTGET